MCDFFRLASNVYQSDSVVANQLRSHKKGRLKRSKGRLLPFGRNPHAPIQFLAGDIRANEQSRLTAMHTLFVREHNRLAKRIFARHPNISDEEIYQRARAIVAAELQIITYNEFLPLLLGEDALGAYTGYDNTINASIANEFSTAAYRVGHTILSPMLLRFDDYGQEIPNGHLTLRDAFFNPQPIIDDAIEPILGGLAAQPAQEIDTLLIDDVRNFLFGAPGSPGFDLASLNIQRGRDHRLPSYNDVRQALGLNPVTSFADITSNTDLQNKLKSAYNDDVNKIDLWVGGLAEDHLPGPLIGETFHRILRDQFRQLRDADRFC